MLLWSHKVFSQLQDNNNLYDRDGGPGIVFGSVCFFVTMLQDYKENGWNFYNRSAIALDHATKFN